MDQIPIRNAISLGINFLYNAQSEWGEFKTYLASTPDMGYCQFDSTVFVTSIILHNLRYLDGKPLCSLKKKARKFLKSEMLPGGVWRYWTARSGKVIAPDIDDTAYVLAVLGNDLDESAIESGRRKILSCRTEEGWFRTWIRPPEESNDVDSVVNANVVAFLGDREETMPACKLLKKIINDKKDSGSFYYYHGEASFLYALSRAIDAGVTSLTPVAPKMIVMLESASTNADPLQAALSACAILNLNCNHIPTLDRLIAFILKTQRPDGSWPKFPFYVGPEAPGPPGVWFGSEELTTGLCIEALSHYLLSKTKPGQPVSIAPRRPDP